MGDNPIAQAAGRSYDEELLDAGVKIYEYQDRVLHAKTLLFDQDWVIIGSANMDVRSFLLNFEVNGVVFSSRLNDELANFFEDCLEESIRIRPEDYRERPLGRRIVESAARLMSPLL